MNAPDMFQIDPVISALYEATLEPERWRDALQAMARLSGAQAAVFVDMDYALSVLWRHVLHNVDEEAHLTYLQRYAQIDPRLPVMMKAPELRWVSDLEALPDAIRLESPVYRDYLRPAGLRECLMAKTAVEGARHGNLVLLRMGVEDVFSAEQRQLLDLLLPHVDRAIRISRRLAAFARALAFGGRGVEEYADPVATLTERGDISEANPAFEALVGSVPVLLGEAGEPLRELLCWQGDAVAAELRPGAPPLERQAWMPGADGTPLRLRSIVRCYKAPGGAPRFMAVVEDRSVEEERDLAQLQIGAMMDTAGVGLATFAESQGWVRQRQGGSGAGGASSALQAIGRDVVLPDSIPEYERLQRALRQGERAEVRYAVRHPDLGQRWLLTRVEPAMLASGKRTTSVVTLDVTEQEEAHRRSEQLLRELGLAAEADDLMVGLYRRLGMHRLSAARQRLLYGALLRRGQREIGRDQQGGLTLNREFVGAGAVEQPAAATARKQQAGGSGRGHDKGFTHLGSALRRLDWGACRAKGTSGQALSARPG